MTTKQALDCLLQFNKGETILSIQTRLFIKTCLIEEQLVRNGSIPKESWRNSFILDQVFGSIIGKIVKYGKGIRNNLI